VNQLPSALLAEALRMPARIAHGSVPWEALIASAREADLLATLAARIDASAGLDSVPRAPRAHLIAAGHRCRAQHAVVRREAFEIARPLAPLATPVILL